jgi:hypothetical protein
MVVIWGQRMYGRVDRFAGSHIATRFFHIYYVPLIPLASWLVLEEKADGNFVGIPLPLQLRSIALAWLRIGSIIALLVAGVNVIQAIDNPYMSTIDGLGSAITVGLSVAFALFAFLKLGKLTWQEKVERVVHWDWSGRFVDAGLLGDARPGVRGRAYQELERHLNKHVTSTYREAATASWLEVATRPNMRDALLLRPALTVCRIDESMAKGADRRRLTQARKQILENLLAASPELRDQLPELAKS